MKVEIFDNTNVGDLENTINDFIKDKEVIDIKYSSILESEYNQIIFSVLIMYKDLKTLDKRD